MKTLIARVQATRTRTTVLRFKIHGVMYAARLRVTHSQASAAAARQACAHSRELLHKQQFAPDIKSVCFFGSDIKRAEITAECQAQKGTSDG